MSLTRVIDCNCTTHERREAGVLWLADDDPDLPPPPAAVTHWNIRLAENRRDVAITVYVVGGGVHELTVSPYGAVGLSTSLTTAASATFDAYAEDAVENPVPLNGGEAQELHELIGAAIEAGDLTGLRRARELASLMIGDD